MTLFEGDIGSGKSSILFAVEFALFGLADVPGDHLLRAGEKEGLIELEFSALGKRYTVGRRLVRSKAGATTQKDAYLVAGGAKEDYSVEQLRAAVIKILGFREPASSKSKSQVFRYGVFTPQEEMKSILEGGAEDRKQTLRRAFGIEEYKRARENADLVKAALRERAGALEIVLEGAPRLEEELAQAARERDAFVAQVEEAQAGRERAAAARREAESRLKASEAVEAKDRELEREIAALRAESAKQVERKAAAEARLKELEGLEAEVPPLTEAAASIPALEQELSQAEAREEERRGHDQELARAEARLKELEARKHDIEAESELIRKVTDDSEAIQAGKRALDAARKQLEKVREEAAAAREAAERVGALKKRLAALEKEAAAAPALEERLKAFEGAVREGAGAADALSALDDKLSVAQGAQGGAASALARVEQDLEELSSLKGKAKCPKCKQPLDAAHLAEHRGELESDAVEARKRLARAQGDARALERQRTGLLKARDEGERAGRERAAAAADLKRSKDAALEAKAAAAELEGAEGAAERLDELTRVRKSLEHEAAGKAHFERRAAELEMATRRWREVSDQFRKVLRDVDATAKAAALSRGKRDSASAEPARVKRLREALSGARMKAAKLREMERRLLTRGDLERHRQEAGDEALKLADREAAAAAEREGLARKLSESPPKKLRAAFEAAASRAAALEERLEGARKGLALQQEAVARAQERLNDSARARARLASVRHTRDFLEQCFQAALEDIELQVLADLNAQLNNRFQVYFARLMEGAPVDVQIDAEFTPEVHQGPHALPVEALSGGERTSIALAYRLALNFLVSRAAGMETPDLLILDEPTDGFSKEQLSRVGELLRDLDCQQVVLVSHERELEACADQVFEVVKDGTVSRVEAR